MQIPVHYKPRWYQAEALRALEKGVRITVWVWARRGGKDMTAFAYAIKKMVETPMNVVLVFPTLEQGRKAFWQNVENDGFKTLDHIPKQLISRFSDKNMTVTLINGSTFSVLGATDPDALRGANGRIYIFSEFVDIDSYALDVIRPITAVNNGQIIIQSTPKIDGISGGMLKILFDIAKKNKKHYCSLITAEEYLDAATLEEIRQEYIEKYGNDFKYRQEFLCDWGQAGSASYYGAVLHAMEDNGHIGLYSYNKDYPVYTVRDLGLSDSTAILFFQYYKVDNKPRVHIIDYYEVHDVSLSGIINTVQKKPYDIAWHFWPHDGSVRDSDAIARIEKAREMGLSNSSLLVREPVDDGINRVIENLGNAVIHQPTTINWVRKMYVYKRKFNPLTGDYMGPEHKSESHAADTTRYLYTALDQEFDKETCAMYLTQASQPETYDSDMPATNIYSPVS